MKTVLIQMNHVCFFVDTHMLEALVLLALNDLDHAERDGFTISRGVRECCCLGTVE
jgi:hypothetical protein